MREAEGGEEVHNPFLGSFCSGMWMGHGLSEVFSEVIRLRLKK